MKALVQELGASLQSLFTEMESSQPAQAIFTSIITALLQSLMLYDNGAGPQTALGCCGSQQAPGITASLNLQDRMFTLMRLHVSRCDQINTSVTLSLLLLSPVQTSHPPLWASSPRCCHFTEIPIWSAWYQTANTGCGKTTRFITIKSKQTCSHYTAGRVLALALQQWWRSEDTLIAFGFFLK